MASTKTIRRHRAGENPAGRPVQDLIDAYIASAVPARTAVPA